MADAPLESNTNLILQVLAGVKSLQAQVQGLHGDICEVKEHLRTLNGTAARHEADLAVLKDWRASQAQAAVKDVADLKVQLAQLAVKYASLGGVVAIVIWVLKALGIF
jgi:hypothetical protein